MPEAADTEQAATWLGAPEAALAARDVPAAALFEEGGYRRDLLTFTWNVKTMEGRPAITAMLEATRPGTKPQGLRSEGEATVQDGLIEAWFTFETAVARGRGILRLRDGKCRTLLTVMQDLKCFEEHKGPTRPQGLVHRPTLPGSPGPKARARGGAWPGGSALLPDHRRRASASPRSALPVPAMTSPSISVKLGPRLP
ncbi:MAG: hypothetical protein HC871_03715 [Rhizobiales bacterium]|nr:hypothetical protein [Hyphomicrobiales bacterium]